MKACRFCARLFWHESGCIEGRRLEIAEEQRERDTALLESRRHQTEVLEEAVQEQALAREAESERARGAHDDALRTQALAELRARRARKRERRESERAKALQRRASQSLHEWMLRRAALRRVAPKDGVRAMLGLQVLRARVDALTPRALPHSERKGFTELTIAIDDDIGAISIRLGAAGDVVRRWFVLKLKRFEYLKAACREGASDDGSLASKSPDRDSLLEFKQDLDKVARLQEEESRRLRALITSDLPEPVKTLVQRPSVPTSRETAPSGYFCTDGRRMVSPTCPSLPEMLIVKFHPRRARTRSPA
ncbi:MAG TPA: hypothetical protein VF316_18965 [Polyangiaceae bacterium]